MDKEERVAEMAEADVSGEQPAAKEADRAAKDDQPKHQPLPPGWCWATLGEVATWRSGGTPSRKKPHYYGGSIPWIKIGDLSDGKIATSTEYITEDALENSAAKWVPTGSVLVALYGASIGKTGILGFPATTNQAIASAVQLWSVDTHFLFNFLGFSKSNFIELGQGGAQPNISQAILKQYPIPLPPLAEQKRIVARIDALFATVEAGERAIAAALADLARYRKSLLKAAVTGDLTADWRAQQPSDAEDAETGDALLERILIAREAAWEAAELAKLKAKDKPLPATEKAVQKFRARYKPPAAPKTDDLPTLPDSWAWASLASLCFVKGGVTVDRKKTPADPVTIPYLRVANVQNGRLNLEEVKTITVSSEKAAQCLLEKGDVLLNEGGDLDKLGRGWVWNDEIENCIHQNHVFRARPVNSRLSSEFISHYANAMGQTFFMDRGKQSVNLASISLTEISKLPIPLPPLKEQREIVSRVEAALSRAEAVEASLKDQAKAAKALKQSILKAAFAGKLVPQDPTDEPAAQMLERVKEAT